MVKPLLKPGQRAGWPRPRPRPRVRQSSSGARGHARGRVEGDLVVLGADARRVAVQPFMAMPDPVRSRPPTELGALRRRRRHSIIETVTRGWPRPALCDCTAVCAGDDMHDGMHDGMPRSCAAAMVELAVTTAGYRPIVLVAGVTSEAAARGSRHGSRAAAHHGHEGRPSEARSERRRTHADPEGIGAAVGPPVLLTA